MARSGVVICARSGVMTRPSMRRVSAAAGETVHLADAQPARRCPAVDAAAAGPGRLFARHLG